VAGRLVGAKGAPVAGARVCVLARVAMPGARWRRIGSRLTGGDGRFTYPVPTGPSRALRLVYRADAVQRERRLRLRVRAVPKLRVHPRRTHNGGRVSFRGRTPGPAGGGRVVALQAEVEGRWRTFESVRTRRRGRFVARYRFRETTEPTTYRFRALVRHQAGYPYARGTSRITTVAVG
jgi:hypothetical protein